MTTRQAFEEWVSRTYAKNTDYKVLSPTSGAWSTWKAATDVALERAAEVRMKLPPAKYGENASAPQQIYQDAFDRGWHAGISAMRGAIRALKEKQ